MAFYIKIKKIEESATSATFQFEATEKGMGVFQIQKESGDIVLISPMPGDDRKIYFNRAGAKILKEWQSGVLPDVTEWAS
jgi:hypothetical protein